MSTGDHHWQKTIFQALLLQNFSGKQLGTNGQLLAPIMCRIAIGIIRNEFETVKINCLLLASRLNIGSMMVRKPGKLPGKLVRAGYDIEYGTAELTIQ